MKNLRELLGLCIHKFDVLENVRVYSEFDMPGKDVPIGRIYVLKCEKCGVIKKKKV